ncbi:MAG: hypothetical protein WC055_02265 [Melioribacteraceae bacterium]
MPDNKPAFNPNKPFVPSDNNGVDKPAFNPKAAYKPLESTETYKDAFTSVTEDIYKSPKEDNKVESAIDFIAKHPTTKGGMVDLEKDILRGVFKNPNASQDQIKESIATMQSGNLYYLKDEGGVMVPKQLKYGEKPPKGYNAQSVWGSQKDANNDSWYTDLGKSLYNGVIGTAEGVVDLAQMGTMAITDDKSDYLANLSNTAEALKFTKDADINKPIFNTEGINQFSDLVDKDRFDISPAALWGTLNMAAESVVSFYGGAKGATTLAKLGPKASAYVGSYLTQLGDNLDNAKEAGLEGREAATFASLTTSVQAAIDAKFGLESKIYQASMKKPAAALFKDLAKGIEKDAEGKITAEGFKQLARETADNYGKLAAIGAKEIGKDALKEAGQEAGQDFVAKAAENLWDKLDINEKAKFGTDVTSAQSFASYIQNGLAGLVGGAPMAIASTNAKKKYDEQSANAYKTVQQGPAAVQELKGNLGVAKEKGQITEPEYRNAVDKVDAYQKYNEQTKDLNLDEKQKKETFELSFNIESLKSEVNQFTKEELDQLDPIALGKIDSKKKIIKGLQEELNKIILREDVQRETKVGQDTVNKVVKNETPKEGEKKISDLLKTFKTQATKVDKVDVKEAAKPEDKKPYRRFAYDRDNTPDFDLKDSKGNYQFNKLTDPISRKRALTDHFDKNPELKDEVEGYVHQSQNNVWQVDVGNGRWMQFARSIDPETLLGDTTNLPELKEDVKDSDGRLLTRYKEPVIVKMETITGDREDRKGKPLRIFNVYRKRDGAYIVSLKERQKGNSDYSDGEKAQMAAIKERGYVPKSKESVKEAVKNRNESVATKVIEYGDKIIAGEILKSPKDIQFYENNKKDIEKYLGEKAAEYKNKVEKIKDKIVINPITNPTDLTRKIAITKKLKGSSKKIQIESNVKSEQNKILKKVELLKKLIDCIHG